MSTFWAVLPLDRRFENTGIASTYLGTVAPSSATCAVSTDADCRNSSFSGGLLPLPLSQAAGASAASIAPATHPRCNVLRVETNRDIAILLNEPTKLVSA